VKLNDRSAEAAVLPAGKTDHVFWDDALPGFGVRLRGDRKHCTKRWLAQYRVGAVQRRESLGDIRKIKIDAARKIARKLFAKAELGVDPAAERAKERFGTTTLATIADRYLAGKRDVLRPTSYAAAVHNLNELWRPLRDRPLEAIKRADIALRLQELAQGHGRAAAARARTHLSALFRWAMGEGLCDVNPCVGTNDPNRGAQARDRALTDAEIRAVWRTCGDDDFSRIVKLLLFLGCRRDEIGALEWTEIDFDASTLTIPGRRTKNGKQLTLTLPEPALEILRAVPRHAGRSHVFGKVGKGFTGMSHAMHRFQARMAAAGNSLPHWSLHDLRRTVRSGLGRLGVPPHVAELVINHQKAGIVAVYDRYHYEPEITRALALWVSHVTAVAEGRKNKVVPLYAAGVIKF
jgi:integrase